MHPRLHTPLGATVLVGAATALLAAFAPLDLLVRVCVVAQVWSPSEPSPAPTGKQGWSRPSGIRRFPPLSLYGKGPPAPCVRGPRWQYYCVYFVVLIALRSHL